MSKHKLPSGIHDLLQRATAMQYGLETHGPWLNLGAARAEKFGPVLAELQAAESDFAAARAAKAAAGARAIAADEALTAWLAKARLVAMLALGAQWSPAWREAGFFDRGTNVPKRLAARMTRSRAVVAWLRAHPEFEVIFAEVTAVRGEALSGELDAAQLGLREAKVDAAQKKRHRDAAESALRRAMGLMIVCVNFCLHGADPRWAAFGLNAPKPHAPRRPAPKHNAAPPATPLEIFPVPSPDLRAAAA